MAGGRERAEGDQFDEMSMVQRGVTSSRETPRSPQNRSRPDIADADTPTTGKTLHYCDARERREQLRDELSWLNGERWMLLLLREPLFFQCCSSLRGA